MKKLILMVVCILSAFAATAQSKVTWSMEVGAGMSAWMGNDADGSNALFNPKVGVGIDIPLTGLVSFKTGLNWVSKGASYKTQVADLLSENVSVSKVKVNQNYFQMPFLAAFHVGTPSNFDMVFTVGPYIAYGISGKSETEIDALTVSWDTFDDLKISNVKMAEGFNEFDAGLQAGIALDFRKWTLGVDGDFGLCKIASKTSAYNFGFFVKVGYKF